MEILFSLNNRCFLDLQKADQSGEGLRETIHRGDKKYWIVVRETSVLPECHRLNALLVCNHGAYSTSEGNFWVFQCKLGVKKI